jgi:hypothetical protein
MSTTIATRLGFNIRKPAAAHLERLTPEQIVQRLEVRAANAQDQGEAFLASDIKLGIATIMRLQTQLAASHGPIAATGKPTTLLSPDVVIRAKRMREQQRREQRNGKHTGRKSKGR